MRPRIKRIDIEGFRGFGRVQQSAEPAETVSVFWGGNSQGKTSLSEAVEFLLTGKIGRRELLAGAKDEFADSLRNAHLDDDAVVTVQMKLEYPDGTERTVKRTLLEDYRRGQASDCETKLEIDGNISAEADIEHVLGLKLFPAPLEAPVLTQHALGFLFSSSPADRAAYFRAVLDTQKLEDFRQDVIALEGMIEEPSGQEVDDLGRISETDALAAAAKRLLAARDKAAVSGVLDTAVSDVLISIGETPDTDQLKRLDQLKRELTRRRATVFPLSGFQQEDYAALKYDPAIVVGYAKAFQAETEKCDAEAAILIQLFEGALNIPDIHRHEADVDCPLCGTEDALTPERIVWIKGQVEAASSLRTARSTLENELRQLLTLIHTMRTAVNSALPKCCAMNCKERKASGFTIERMRQLSADETLIADWLSDLKVVWRRAVRMTRALNATEAKCQQALERSSDWDLYPEVNSAFETVFLEQTATFAALESLEGPRRRLVASLRQTIDAASSVDGWDVLIRLASDPEGVLAGSDQIRTHAETKKALSKAVREIDKGIGIVQDQKFGVLSDEVRRWWKRLRPDESTFFDGVKRRSARTRRMIDLKAGLSRHEDGSDAKLRDAVAVFSQSQLHCLGLAIFLARASAEEVGFILLDDPVLTSDEDYRPNFASTVIEGLLGEGIQTLIATQDYSTAKDIGTRWAHREMRRFNIVRNDPSIGSEIRSEEDDLAAMISRAHPFCNSEDPEQRKIGGRKVREAIERFSKLILVKDRQCKGDSVASITDYDGKNFGEYGNSVKALLVKDPAHPGKLQAAHNYVSPAPHDDNPPSKSNLKVALGDLRRLKSDYLD
tara:strand:- start:5577 stop:8096 length:2520 start_codon:yes stop_codon:yes gene_type:complete